MHLRTSSILVVLLASLWVGCGSGSPFAADVMEIEFTTTSCPPAGAGQLYDFVLQIETRGGAADAVTFVVESGVLPPGIRLIADTDANGDPNGHACLLGYPREIGSFTFTVKAISTGGRADPKQPDVVARHTFTITVSEGKVAILSPTAEEGSVDVAVPAFPDTIPFVNPANSQAFYSFAWEIAGGSGNNTNTVYMPRELELSSFDEDVVDLEEDTIESGDKFDPAFADGGWFALQAGNDKVQVGGFQSPRGPVGTITSLDPDWFQLASVPKNSRRDLANSGGFVGGDTTLGTPAPVVFTDYFAPGYKETHPDANPRAKYPFTADQYANAFFVPFTPGVDITPLRFRVIVESIDTNGTPTDLADDVIARKAYIVQVAIPQITLDTIVLPGATAGVDYTTFFGAGGGVPPLTFELEYVDGVVGDGITENTPGSLTKALLGLEMDATTGQFFGVPRVTGSVDLTMRAYADVMSPVQSGAATVPAGGEHEFDGTLPVTGKTGRHVTITIDIADAPALFVANATLKGGVDGVSYAGDQLSGSGGVPTLIPDPIGFTGPYPSNARRTYGFGAQYVMDASHGANEGKVDPTRELPNALVLDGDRFSPTNGVISGIAYDRGFHTVTVTITDANLGPATAPLVSNATIETRALNLSVGPDRAMYMRGVQKTEGTGEATGLLDATAAMGESRMVPMFLKSGIFTGGTGVAPKLYAANDMPGGIDILPVMLANGGSDAHVNKAEPSISGYWPSESNKVNAWFYYYYGATDTAWKHLQQETTWIQTPTPEHLRVFLWAETKIKSYNGGTGSTSDYKRYQQFDLNGKRGVMVQNPITGEVWIPAILNNTKNDGDGATFGAEYVLDCAGSSPSHSSYGYVYAGYERYYKYASYMRGTREARLQGLGSYLESNQQSSNGKLEQGRTAVSVVMSADGLWGATALPGGDTQMFLLWRTDRQPIPQKILDQNFVTPVNGRDVDGGTLANSACIVRLGGETASGKFITDNPRYLLPDSMMFVRDGLLFLMEAHLDYVFGFSLVDGHLSSKSVNSRTTPNGQGPSANSTRGQYIPDQDYLRAQCGGMGYAVQFAFTGNKPADGEEGPDKVAFIAGDNFRTYSFNDYSSTYNNLSTDFSGDMRRGYAVSGNRNKALLFLSTSTGATGLDLGASGLRDLTGNSSLIYGDLLTPGRLGEELDFLAVSPDGKYVAVVRDYSVGSSYSSTYYGLNPTFGTATTSASTSTSYYRTADDILLISTTGDDMDSGTAGPQPVLFIGTNTNSSSFSGTPSPNSATYASAAPWVNAAGRRINGVMFSEDSKTLLFRYAGHNSYNPKYWGGSIQYAINGVTSGSYTQSSSYASLASQLSLRFHFRTSADKAVDFRSSSAAASFMKNNLQGLSGIKPGDTSAPFTISYDAEQQFWAMFKSPNGKFLYMVSDQLNSRNFLVGFNISAATINGHKPFEPFSPHAATIGFEQFDVNSFNYENRFAAVPGGQTAPTSGRTGEGIVFAIGSDASAGAISATDLEVYVFDANIGGNMIVLTSDVTDGTKNAINHITVSADGNIIVGQRAETTSNSGSGRTLLNSDTDLFAVTNVHDVLAGSAPTAFFLSEDMSHGSTVAFVGEGKGPAAVFYSSAAKGSTNKTWALRTLKVGLLQPGAGATVADGVQSHYVVLSGGRVTDDDAESSD